jgi:hypothetical protein
MNILIRTPIVSVKVFIGLILDKSGQDIKERCLSWQEAVLVAQAMAYI